MTEKTNRSLISSGVLLLLTVYGIGLLVYWGLYLTVGDDWNWLALLHNGAPYLFVPAVVGLLLALILRAQRLFGLYILLVLIGFFWFTVPLIPRPLPPTEGVPLKLVTFNVYPENERLDTVESWLLGQDADVLLLQEVNGDLPQLDAAYPHQHTIQADETGNRHWVLSRYPIVGAGQFLLDDIAQQRVVLDINGELAAVYNLHLFMPLNENEDEPLLLRYDEARRNEQISELMQIVASESETPLIVAGDFNMSDYSPIYRTLASRLTDAYRVAAWGLGSTWPGGASEELPDVLPRLVRLDYVWYTGENIQAQDARVGGTDVNLGSDHLPVVVTLDIVP